MTDAGYVIAGWSLTAVALAAYAARLAARARRAERSTSEQ
jgi:hypothetical protein